MLWLARPFRAAVIFAWISPVFFSATHSAVLILASIQLALTGSWGSVVATQARRDCVDVCVCIPRLLCQHNTGQLCP